MDITLYFFLFSIISVLFFFYWYSNYVVFPILIIVLSLSGVLLVINSPPYMYDGLIEETQEKHSGIMVTTIEVIKTEIPIMNNTFLTTFFVMFLLAVLMWTFGRDERREFQT